MCGLTVIVNQNHQPVLKSVLQGAIDQVRHRGPDDEGYYLDGHLGMGHCRLSIFDLTSAGRQPLTYLDYQIVFNGAIYNYLELKEELTNNGYRFFTQTDTEVIVAAYDCWGPTCTGRFNGMWAFVIYDRRQRQLFASRDRFGIKPLYYAQIGSSFCLASELKQFLSVPGWQSRINLVRSYEYLAFGYQDHTVETLLEGAFQLLPGYQLVYDLDQHQFVLEQYYSLENRVKLWTDSFDDAKVRFRKLLKESVKLRMRADVKVGSALSGGLDSSSIVTLMDHFGQNSSPIETVSVCFPAKFINEEQYVDAIAGGTHILAHKLWPGQEQIMQSLDRVVWNQDGPIASAGVIAQNLVFEKASELGIKVMLDGQGSDEILAGYEKFYWTYLRNLFAEQPLQGLSAAWNIMTKHRWNLTEIFKRASFLHVKRKQQAPPWLNRKFTPSPAELFRRPSESEIRQVSLNLLSGVGMRILLHYEDRNSAAYGVESRVPFLDHRLVEFCLGLPEQFKIRTGIRKYILRESMRDHLPQKITSRFNKLGFATPDNAWLGIDPAAAINRAKNNHPAIFNTAETRHNDEEWWRIVTFDRWLELLGLKYE